MYNNKIVDVKNTQLNCDNDNVIKFVMFPVAAKKIKIKIAPKNILPKATTLDESSFRTCFDIIVSKDHNKTAERIKISAKPKLNDLVISNNKLPANNNTAAIMKLLFNFSFNKRTAKIETKINMDLWINDEDALAEIESPLKNNRNGIEPPNKPIAISLNH